MTWEYDDGYKYVVTGILGQSIASGYECFPDGSERYFDVPRN